ncbi:MAG: hypothetical protein AAB725_00155 [Patescibacteria group bacterium]
MESDVKELLRKNLEASERTLHLVEKMHRAALWARFFSFLKWVVIVGATVWGYLALQPYLEKALGLSREIGNLQNSLPQNGGLENIIKSFLDR